MKRTNKNGMTLVEIVISMTILAAIAGMFVTVAVAAKKKNADTYMRSNEMYEQAAAAEAFSTNTDYGVNVKVSKLLADGSDNEFSIVADFGTLKLDSKAYGYMARRQDKDKNDTNYQLRFFRSDNVDIAAPNPAEGEYWVKVYNHSGVEQSITFNADCGGFYTNERESLGPSVSITVPNENKTAVGYCIGEGDTLFSIVDFDDPSKTLATFTQSSLIDYMEEKDGSRTGFIIIHICDGLEIKTQAEYEEASV